MLRHIPWLRPIWAGSLLLVCLALACEPLVPQVAPWNFAVGSACGGDWPQWRYDRCRTASSPEVLPERLTLAWVRRYGPRRPAWDSPINRDKMSFDRAFEPIVCAGRVIVPFNDSDKVVALDLADGRELWRFYTDGPVRLPPVGWQDRIFVASDDGCLYCLRVTDGRLLWKRPAGPTAHKTLGNRRLVSMWPARGGPVVCDGVVYFASGIWPFLGVFLYALDAQTGQVLWVNDRIGPHYSLQPHASAGFGGVAPQGALLATDKLILAPGGRSLPAAFDRSTGELVYFHNAGLVGGKHLGGSFVAAARDHYFVHAPGGATQQLQLTTGRRGQLALRGQPVIGEDQLYVPGGVRSPGAARDADGQPAQMIQALGDQQWTISVDASGDLIRAGSRLYAAGRESIAAIDLPKQPNDRPQVAWSLPLKGPIVRLLAANRHLLAVSLQGDLYAWSAPPKGTKEVDPLAQVDQVRRQHEIQPNAVTGDQPQVSPASDPVARSVRAVVAATESNSGYALVAGIGDGKLISQLLALTKLRLIVVESDPQAVAFWREKFDQQGRYGHRIAIHQGRPASFRAPPYFAQLVLITQPLVGEPAEDSPTQSDREALAACVRPYGGGLWLVGVQDPQHWRRVCQEDHWGQATISQIAGGTLIRRTGPLPGSADWNHLYGDPANTGQSQDRRVKPPLGVLWFGGNSHQDARLSPVAPSEQVVAGRLFIHGINQFSARDVYTGSVLWRVDLAKQDQQELPKRGIPPEGANPIREDVPADPFAAYKPPDIYQANTRGTNFVATADRVYISRGRTCRVLEAKSGQLLRVLQLPPYLNRQEGPQDRRLLEDQPRPEWGYLAVVGDVLLGGWGYGDFSQRLGGQPVASQQADKMASGGLVAFDRHSGRVLWKVSAEHGFLHNGIAAGRDRVYCLDRLPPPAEAWLERRGQQIRNSRRLIALDLQSGHLVWERRKPVFGTWLSYSAKHDLLVQALDYGPARLSRRTRGVGLACHNGRDGSLSWHRQDLAYFGPCLLLGETILTNGKFYDSSAGAFSLLDGSTVTVSHPLTGAPEPWKISRGYGCNSMRASQTLLTYRSGCAAYYDLATKAGTSSLGGFRSGCTSNLIIANGVLNAPDYTRHCTCTFQQQTSLALASMPELPVESWSCQYGPLNPHDFLDFQSIPVRAPIRRVGINLGAPGDRQRPGGTLWLEYPVVGGASYDLPLKITGKNRRTLRRHEGFLAGPVPWVCGSALEGIRSLEVELDAPGPKPGNSQQTRYTMRLYFAELTRARPGERVFDVAIQGRDRLRNFDPVREARGPNRGLVKEFSDILARGRLKVTLRPSGGSRPPILSGVEILQQSSVGR